ncbi:MAG TPA: hypothetical protein VN914_15055 [Polyangia bacterium]|nr:hypothetical protein [Polyangia bacterium]
MLTRAITPRRMVLLAALAGGCVIPVGPQFDKPETNYPPYVVTSTPTVGEIFTPSTAEDGRQITATISDQNLHDNLFIRFLVDYPGTDTSLPHLLLGFEIPPSGAAERSPVHIQPSCQQPKLAMGPHRLIMVVSDRPFFDALLGQDVDPEAPFDSVPEEANRIRVLWTLNCPGG